MKKALLCVSFGTSVESARESIAAVENVLRMAAPDHAFARAFTSSIIRRKLAKGGENIPGVEDALEQLHNQGVDEVFVQPTHILYGNEYDKIRAEMEPWMGNFADLKLGKPLLADNGDLQRFARLLSEAYPAEEGTAQVMFGHGTEHFANAVYPALQTVFRLSGRKDMLVGTVEGWPALEDVIAQLKESGFKKVHLVPMMLVAGDHAMNDMAGEEDSWKTRLEAEGLTVSCTMTGLGMMPAVQELYREHMEQLL